MSQSLLTMFYSLFDEKHLVVASHHHPGLSEGRVVIMGCLGDVSRAGACNGSGPSAFSPHHCLPKDVFKDLSNLIHLT